MKERGWNCSQSCTELFSEEADYGLQKARFANAVAQYH